MYDCSVYSDGDGILNFLDNAPLLPNPQQSDVDNDGLGKCLKK